MSDTGKSVVVVKPLPMAQAAGDHPPGLTQAHLDAAEAAMQEAAPLSVSDRLDALTKRLAMLEVSHSQHASKFNDAVHDALKRASLLHG